MPPKAVPKEKPAKGDEGEFLIETVYDVADDKAEEVSQL